MLEINDKKSENLLSEYKLLYKWILSWYIENHLKFNSLNSLKENNINSYIDRSYNLVNLISYNIPNKLLYLDNLDKIIFKKIPESFIKINNNIEHM
tara:strand:+ start:37 stop:324 length:288 start_codon:yes stop_codon:yes gene_type:complete